MRASFRRPVLLPSSQVQRSVFAEIFSLSERESTVFDPMKRWLMTGFYRRVREAIPQQSPYSIDVSTRGVGTPTSNIRSEAYRRKQVFGFTISNTIMRLDIRKDSRSEVSRASIYYSGVTVGTQISTRVTRHPQQHLGGVSVARHSIRIHLIRQWCLLLLFLPSSTKMRACGCRIFGIVFAC